MRQKLIACFQDTLARCNSEALAARTAAAVASSRVIGEGFQSQKLHPVREVEIQVVEGTSFAAARENCHQGRVAVLNFANPHYPGGGVERGAMAQEECLCRSSSLYPCLSGEGVFADFYQYHRTRTDYDFSDRLILSPGVTVFKDDATVPVEMAGQEWFQVDVITCAAPYLAKRRHWNRDVLLQLFRQRVRNILEGALELEAEVLVLGAFGCGAFGNPPEVVAQAFHEILQEQRYRSAFSQVIFAIKSTVGGDLYTVCPNLAAFEMAFFGASKELEKLRYVGGSSNEPGTDDVRMPGGRIRYRGSESREYHQWKHQNPYFGKNFSILGDSISTLEGFNIRGNGAFYDKESREQTGIWEMEDTWWGKVIGFFGGQLLVNDSMGGCQISRPKKQREQYPAGCSDQRTGRLHVGTVMPDVILVNLGWNDWASGVPLMPEGEVQLETADTYFTLAYGLMLNKLKKNYPGAEIWCMTLGKTTQAGASDFRFPVSHGGIPIDLYNRQIANAAMAAGCCVADVAGFDLPLDSLDGSHPTPAGMDTLAMLMVRQMADEQGSGLLDCALTHAPVGGICRRCGKALPQNRENTLKLKLRSNGKVLSTQGWLATLGRSPDCDLVVENGYVARSQAVFTCREGKWFLRDKESRNGTWLNGVRLEANAEYVLRPGDRISFAGKEEAEVL